VYVLANYGKDKLFKIGCTTNIKRRYQDKGTHADIVTLITIPAGMNMYRAESEIHGLMRSKRRGQMEVFDLSPDDIQILKGYRFEEGFRSA
jgi:hypothetical protein